MLNRTALFLKRAAIFCSFLSTGYEGVINVLTVLQCKQNTDRDLEVRCTVQT
jgi:hypothetical protein